jgi:DNA repair photolyase
METSLRQIHKHGIDELSTVTQHSNSPTCPKGMLELNPAFGCQFRCTYCGIYALEKNFYNEVAVYDDFPEYLDTYCTRNAVDLANKYFYFSAKTDCLQSVLVESGITLKILRVLRKHNLRYFIVTKGGLPSQEIQDELLNSRDLNQVIISATTPDENLREILEPGTPSVDARMELARFCIENGIFTTASCCPILPLDDGSYMADTVERCSSSGLSHFYFDFARLSREGIMNLIKLFPEYRTGFEKAYFTPDAQITRWRMSHRDMTIDKYQPPLKYMLNIFERMRDMVQDVAPDATVSVCNHFSTPETLPGYNARAHDAGISCIGHRFV